MLEKAKELIEQYALGKRVAAAVSGGEDSMALLCLLLPYARENKLSLCVVNVDHGIRENSAHDSAFVETFCRENGIAFFGERVDVPALCKQSGRGIEEQAHIVRKEVFARLVREGKCDLVATAHHARDNAETVLLHLFRGCGLQGLSGMRVRTDDGVFRPLLTTEKEEISAFVAAHAIPFVTDESNADTAYDRNYIRHEILPVVAARFPAAQRAICRTAAFAAQADEELRAHIDENAFTVSDGAVSLREDRLTAPYIFAALQKLGQRADVYATAIESVQKLKDCKPCARVDLGNGVVAAREYGAICFYRAAPVACPVVPYAPAECAQRIDFAGRTLVLRPVEPTYTTQQKGTLVFCTDGLPDGCVWRTRRDGDRFTPYGGGNKKLKEYLIDRKIPQRERDALPLLCSGARVLVIAGVEIADEVKLTENSRRAVSVRICADDTKE